MGKRVRGKSYTRTYSSLFSLGRRRIPR